VVSPPAELNNPHPAPAAARLRRRAVEAGEEVAKDIARRDAADSTRAASPLYAADDALVIDTTNRPIDEIVEEVLSKL
jgi:cytidylate kinase